MKRLGGPALAGACVLLVVLVAAFAGTVAGPGRSPAEATSGPFIEATDPVSPAAIRDPRPLAMPAQTMSLAPIKQGVRRRTVVYPAFEFSGRSMPPGDGDSFVLYSARRFTGKQRYDVFVRNDGDGGMTVRVWKIMRSWWAWSRVMACEVRIQAHGAAGFRVAGMQAQEEWYFTVAGDGMASDFSGDVR
ncbi:hypothetical protein DSM100685_1040 [Bifidobacterium avesanii]|nr:hypothetical protein DSM100685_1040 [Bifidobacterium avesanii]